MRECLITDDLDRADMLARQLDAINRERRDIEAGMREMAEARLDALVEALEKRFKVTCFVGHDIRSLALAGALAAGMAAAAGGATVGATSAPRARGRAVRTAPTLEAARKGCTSAPFLRREGTWVSGAV